MQAASSSDLDQRVTGRYLARAPRLAFHVFGLLVVVLMIYAWSARDLRYLQAESGLGYALGIVGGSLMLLLLMYPLRKRLRFMRSWLTLPTWFRLHMLLGVLGPCCILLHCNFRLGSTNSSVALAAMLLVAGSGLIGRYLYGKFHYGLYGEQIRLKQLAEDLDAFYGGVHRTGLSADVEKELSAIYRGCRQILERQQQAISLRALLRQRGWLRSRKRHLARVASSTGGELEVHFRALTALLERLAGFRLFERLFALWHVVHIPVFLLMVVTAITHVLVVHWY